MRTKTPHYLTFSVRHLVQSSNRRYGVYLIQPSKIFQKRRVSRWTIYIEVKARDSNATLDRLWKYFVGEFLLAMKGVATNTLIHGY